MKLLVKLEKNTPQLFLVNLNGSKIIRRVAGYISKRKFSKAITAALSEGDYVKEVTGDDYLDLDVDIIVTEKYVYRDLT